MFNRLQTSGLHLSWQCTVYVIWVPFLPTHTFAVTGLWNHSLENTWSWLEFRNKGYKSYLHTRAHLWKQIPSEQRCLSGAPKAEMWDLTGTCVGSTSNHCHRHLSAEDSDQALLVQCVDSSPTQHELENFPYILCWSSPRAECRILLQNQASVHSLQHSAFKFFDTLCFFCACHTK